MEELVDLIVGFCSLIGFIVLVFVVVGVMIIVAEWIMELICKLRKK